MKSLSLTTKEIKEIKEEYPNAQIKYMGRYGSEITYSEDLEFIAAKYNPKANELVFLQSPHKQ